MNHLYLHNRASQVEHYETGRHWAIGYADFNRDGLEDVLVGYVSYTTQTTPVKMFLQAPTGELVEDSSLLPHLVNDGSGGFSVTHRCIPCLGQGYYTSEIIDVDDDGYCDLIVGGHEHEGAPTRIYWGDSSHKYSIFRSTVVSGDIEYSIVLDVDAEDLDGDGVREIVVTRTNSSPFYKGYYFQIIKQRDRRLEDASLRIVPDRTKWKGSKDIWVPWVVLRDFNGDGHRDIVVTDKDRDLVYLNDGRGFFNKAR